MSASSRSRLRAASRILRLAINGGAPLLRERSGRPQQWAASQPLLQGGRCVVHRQPTCRRAEERAPERTQSRDLRRCDELHRRISMFQGASERGLPSAHRGAVLSRRRSEPRVAGLQRAPERRREHRRRRPSATGRTRRPRGPSAREAVAHDLGRPQMDLRRLRLPGRAARPIASLQR